MQNEEEIRELMQTGMKAEATGTRALRAVSRARRQVGQRDTLGFALFRLWSVLALLMAPFFAFLGERQARVRYRQETARPGAPQVGSNKTDQKGESG